jgi:hypothetical protein
MSLLSFESVWPTVVRAETATIPQAGLLTFGSCETLRLPIHANSGSLQRSSPITAAGPSPNCTGFPFKRNAQHLVKLKWLITKIGWVVKMIEGTSPCGGFRGAGEIAPGYHVHAGIFSRGALIHHQGASVYRLQQVIPDDLTRGALAGDSAL